MERMTEKGPNGYFVRLVKNGTQAHKINIVEDESVCEEILVDPLNEVRKTVQTPVTRIEGDIVERLAAYENSRMEPEIISELQVEAALAYMELQKELQKWKDLEQSGLIVVMPDPKKTPVLEKGTPVWYVDRENGEIEPGKIFISAYENGKLDSFSVDFDSGDFDEFLGSAWGTCFFGSEEQAKGALIAKKVPDAET